MLKLLDYIFYKFYRAHLKGSLNDIAGWAAVVNMGLLLFLNLFVIGVFLRKLKLIPFFIEGKLQAIFFLCLLILISYFLFLFNHRYKKINSKFYNENDHQRKRGNLLVRLYVIVSFLLVFVIAFYKPGKL